MLRTEMHTTVLYGVGSTHFVSYRHRRKTKKWLTSADQGSPAEPFILQISKSPNLQIFMPWPLESSSLRYQSPSVLSCQLHDTNVDRGRSSTIIVSVPLSVSYQYLIEAFHLRDRPSPQITLYTAQPCHSMATEAERAAKGDIT